MPAIQRWDSDETSSEDGPRRYDPTSSSSSGERLVSTEIHKWWIFSVHICHLCLSQLMFPHPAWRCIEEFWCQFFIRQLMIISWEKMKSKHLFGSNGIGSPTLSHWPARCSSKDLAPRQLSRVHQFHAFMIHMYFTASEPMPTGQLSWIRCFVSGFLAITNLKKQSFSLGWFSFIQVCIEICAWQCWWPSLARAVR